MNGNTYKHFGVYRDDRDVVTVWIQHATRSVNVFDDEVITELRQIVGELEEDRLAKLIVFRSAHESGFMAGADVSKIAQLTVVEVEEALATGQALFTRIASLDVPTLAVISGPCLGGGLEFALACRYRIAQESSSTRFGLPEVQLGVIPGWGGTQRLPRRVGLLQSLPMILQGKKMTAGKAFEIGLVDRIAGEGNWKSAVDQFIQQLLKRPYLPQHKPRKSLASRFFDHTSIGRRIVLHRARNQTARESAHYPAISAAIRAVEAGLKRKGDGFATERSEFSRLIETPTCRNLLELFFRRERARSVATWRSPANREAADQPFSAHPTFHKIGVIGSGVMGAGIAQLAAMHRYHVVIKEISEELVAAGMSRIERSMSGLVASGRLPAADAQAAMGRISATCDWDPLESVDLVIEAVVERDDVKAKVFRELSKVVNPHGVLTSNTSSLSIAHMADASNRPQQVGGLHFFNPVHRMELVEVVRASATSDAVVDELVQFVRSLGKTPIVTSDTPGFLVNRILFPYIGEAIQMICDGMEAEAIDREARRFGMPMGPLELLDQVGIDVAYHVSGALDSVLRDNERVVTLLGKMVAAGWIGCKSGQGFYRYDGKHRGAPSPMKAITNGVPTTMVPHLDMATDGLSDMQRRLIYPLINESVQCLQQRVVAEAWMVDLAMVLGTGFAPFRGGPLSMAEGLGWKAIARNMKALEVMYGIRFEPATRLEELASTGGTLYASSEDRSGFGSQRLTRH
ncbi:Fatty acid oxidation complex subunit alpha [Rosistilla ulvae]|uniref:enoyl-CoA hydratase n=1 Tax=Rosistilla ulvae TaxID=1930277 RepID=A0A517M455_9BACT|nr:3-hydroxyacyl-CoA dehydrogenase NAD-binding domain-containing protein [Rosistilla ulvae]QDS89647.1 Fatty acid oxidation complex subunit alpha [Rosistilla ulvae]